MDKESLDLFYGECEEMKPLAEMALAVTDLLHAAEAILSMDYFSDVTTIADWKFELDRLKRTTERVRTVFKHKKV